MALAPMNFQVPSAAQSGMFGSGLSSGLQDYLQFQKNLLARQNLQAELQKMQLGNQQLGIQNQYLPGQSQANIALAQAQARDAAARAGLTGAQTNLLQQQTPSMVQQEQNKVYTDPILSRLRQYQMAQQTGAISPNLLGSIGLGGGSQGNMPQGNVPQGTMGAPSANAQGNINQIAPVSGATPATAPNAFAGNAGQNWALFGSPFNPFQTAAMKQQATTNVDMYNTAQQQAATDSKNATDLERNLNQFTDAYDKSTYKGARLGSTPSSGWLAPPGDLTQEMKADQAATNMQAAMAKTLQASKMTNQELGFAGKMKVNRTMTPQAVAELSDFIRAKAGQLGEYQNFLNSAKNQGVDPQTAQTLWTNYINQRPVYDFQTTSQNKNFQGTANDYLSPQAVNAARNGQSYVPIAKGFKNQQAKNNWFNGLKPLEQQAVEQQLNQQRQTSNG